MSGLWLDMLVTSRLLLQTGRVIYGGITGVPCNLPSHKLIDIITGGGGVGGVGGGGGNEANELI